MVKWHFVYRREEDIESINKLNVGGFEIYCKNGDRLENVTKFEYLSVCGIEEELFNINNTLGKILDKMK